jgi:DNA polymerase-3 subunit epsilon
MLREVVLDTETTGTDPASGDRVVEIGMVELLNHIPTGETRQIYCNPQRPMPEGAFRVHGLSDQFLPTSRSSPRSRTISPRSSATPGS